MPMDFVRSRASPKDAWAANFLQRSTDMGSLPPPPTPRGSRPIRGRGFLQRPSWLSLHAPRAARAHLSGPCPRDGLVAEVFSATRSLYRCALSLHRLEKRDVLFSTIPA